MSVPFTQKAGAMLVFLFAGFSLFARQQPKPDTTALPPPVVMTVQQDHQQLLDLLKITSPRRGTDGRNSEAPNAANYDESKANPYPDLPNPLVLKNGKKVGSAKVWWKKRRAEIVEDFDREIYGRVPKNTPRVAWEVTGTAKEVKYDMPVVTKQLVGRVDNSSYPLIKVDIQLTLTTPSNASGAVPVIMEFGFGAPRPAGVPGTPQGGGLAGAPVGAPKQPPGGNAPSWQQQVLAKG